MGSLEYLERRGDEDLPFVGWFTDEVKHSLEVLRLNNESTVADVRRVAITARSQMREGNLNADSARALFWALHQTRDCLDGTEFVDFLIFDSTFEEIEKGRFASQPFSISSQRNP